MSAEAGPNVIEIHDPVAGVQYTLEPRDHKSRKISTTHIEAIVGTVPPAPPPPPPPPSGYVTNGNWQVANRTTPAPTEQRQRPEISHESLGAQVIEGVSVEGSRTTAVYPTGFFGNDRPITTVSETWTSPELKLTVLSKNSDPRTGERTIRLTNISCAEPDPSLFQVPADYEIIDSQPPRRVQ